jgi:hypothetical protein
VTQRAGRARGAILQRTEDDALAYAIGAGMGFASKPTAADFVDALVTLARAGDPRFSPLKQALLLNAPPDAARWLEDTLKARLAWVMTPEQRHATFDGDLPEDDDEDEDFESDLKVAKQRARARPKPLGQTVSTTDTFKAKGSSGFGQRAKGAGGVTATMETIEHVGGAIQRPTMVSGFVDPQATTGRPNAPEPSSGIRVGVQSKLVDQKITRNTGIIDAQKGHIMALELGGPDKPWNIVPQWGNWQGNGVWRKAEVAILKLAQDAATRGNRLMFEAKVLYKLYAKPAQGTLKGLTFPTRFLVIVQEYDKAGKPVGAAQVMFDDQQHRDHTDDMIADRVFDALDAKDDGSTDTDMG